MAEHISTKTNNTQKVALINNSILKKNYTTRKVDREWFSCLLQHLDRKQNASIFTTPEPTWDTALFLLLLLLLLLFLPRIAYHLSSQLFLSDFIHVLVNFIMSSLTFHQQLTVRFVCQPATTFQAQLQKVATLDLAEHE